MFDQVWARTARFLPTPHQRILSGETTTKVAETFLNAAITGSKIYPELINVDVEPGSGFLVPGKDCGSSILPNDYFMIGSVIFGAGRD